MTDTSNPLRSRDFRIPFQRIRPKHVEPGVRGLLAEAWDAVEEIVSEAGMPTWKNTLDRFEVLSERVRRGMQPVRHLLAVAESPELRAAWAEVLPEISAFWTRLYLHEGLWERMKAFADTEEAAGLDPLRARHLGKTLRDFRRSGAELDPEGRKRLEEIEVELSQLEQRFSENVLDATAAFTIHVTDQGRLEGIPDDARRRFRARAERDGLDGWVLTLDHPSAEAVLKHARDRELRRTIHQASLARGREEPHDNRSMIPQMLALRQEKAKLLGYPDFPSYRLEEQMAKSGERAREFVGEMVERTRPFWRRDAELLQEFAEREGIAPLRPWDVSFAIERLRLERFDFDEEMTRPYFPLDSLLEGLWTMTERLFGLRVEEAEIEEVWHPDVRYFRILDAEGGLVGAFYADFFPRDEKRQGAWMNDLISGAPGPDGDFEPHLGLICANFPPPTDEQPSLLGHRDVETLFHEFGHLLHHCTSRVPIPSRGGVNVAWDWVEVPSQLLENWTWERESLDLFARHWKTGEPFPQELLERMLRARRFMKGWVQMRQLGFGTLDLALHTEYDPEQDGDPEEWVTGVLEPLSLDRTFAEAHPLPSFLHLFSGGYAASYYSYIWSEVLEADLFTRFRDRGVFDRETGSQYLETILSAGDREDPEVLFQRFMGREPDPEVLIRRNLGTA